MTDTAATERAMTDALTTIRTCWADMLTPPGTGGIAKAPTGTVTLADDHSDTDADTARLDRIVSLRREVAECLNGWARIIIEDRPVTKAVPQGGNVPQLVAFLERHAEWFSGHEAAEDAAKEIRGWAGKVRRASGEPEVGDTDELVVQTVNAGRCPVVDGSDHPFPPSVCATTIRLPVHHDEATEVACKGCGTVDTVEGWIGRIVGAEELVTIPQLAEALRVRWGKAVSERTLRRWYKSGRIKASLDGDTPRFDRRSVFTQLADQEAAELVAEICC